MSEYTNSFYKKINQLLRRIACGVPVDEVIEGLIEALETVHSELTCSAMVINGRGSYLRFHSASASTFADNPSTENFGESGTENPPRVIVYEVVNEHQAGIHTRNFAQATSVRKDSEAWIRSVFSPQGEFLGVMSVVFDGERTPTPEESENISLAADLLGIAMSKHLAAVRLLEAEEQRNAASAANGEFLANMSHEIRTPLTAILGFAESLREQEITEEQRATALDAIIRNGDHLLRLINDVLDLSKAKAGKLDIFREKVNLFSLVSEVLDLLRGKAINKGLELRVDYVMPLPALIWADSVRLKQILVNLAGNAIKFTDSGHVLFRVSYDKTANKIILEVEDSGIGIAQDVVANLSKPFVQADAAISRQHGGTGLGLFIARSLAECMGGGLACRSELGKGSVFTVWFDAGPNASASLVSKMQVPSDRADLEQLDVPQLTGDVLVVEDNPDNRTLLIWLLKKAGLQVEVAENGRDGVQMCRAKEYGLILMDMQMPILDGVSATKELRESGYVGPIVGMTAVSSHGETSRLLAAGCNATVSKPFRRQEFFSVLNFYLAQELESLDDDWSGQSQNEEIKEGRFVSPSEKENDDDVITYQQTCRGRALAKANADFINGLRVSIELLTAQDILSDLAQLRKLVHKLSGASGLFGYDDLGCSAGDIEEAIDEGRKKEEVGLLLDSLVKTMQIVIGQAEMGRGNFGPEGDIL